MQSTGLKHIVFILKVCWLRIRSSWSFGKRLWLRNNASTILCNCAENFGFITLAFIGIYDLETILTIAISTSIIEAIVAVCDTPFLYVAGMINKKL